MGCGTAAALVPSTGLSAAGDAGDESEVSCPCTLTCAGLSAPLPSRERKPVRGAQPLRPITPATRTATMPGSGNCFLALFIRLGAVGSCRREAAGGRIFLRSSLSITGRNFRGNRSGKTLERQDSSFSLNSRLHGRHGSRTRCSRPGAMVRSVASQVMGCGRGASKLRKTRPKSPTATPTYMMLPRNQIMPPLTI